MSDAGSARVVVRQPDRDQAEVECVATDRPSGERALAEAVREYLGDGDFMEDFSDVEIRALESAFDRNDYAAVAAWWESLGGRTSHWIGLRLIETKVSSWA